MLSTGYCNLQQSIIGSLLKVYSKIAKLNQVAQELAQSQQVHFMYSKTWVIHGRLWYKISLPQTTLPPPPPPQLKA